MAEQKCPRWTQADTAAMIRHAANGLSMAATAKEMRRSRSAVHGRAARHGVAFQERGTHGSRRFWSEADDRDLLEMRTAGLSYAQIAARLNRTPGAVNFRAYQLAAKSGGLPRATSLPPLWTPAENQRLIAMARAGASSREIAAELGRSRASVINRISAENQTRPREERIRTARWGGAGGGAKTRAWTRTEEDRLIALVRALHLSADAIAADLGRTADAVRGRVAMLRGYGVDLPARIGPDTERARRSASRKKEPAHA